MLEKCCKINVILNALIATLFCSFFSAGQAIAQSPSQKIHGYFTGVSAIEQKLFYATETKRFYVRNGFAYAWLSKQNIADFQILLVYFKQSANLGLEQDDHVNSYCSQLKYKILTASSEDDSINADIAITDAAIHFFHDVAEGNQTEDLLYNGLNYFPGCINIDSILFVYLNTGKFSFLLSDLEPHEKIYESMKEKLQFFQQIISIENFKDAQVKSESTDANRRLLITRLYQLGLLASDTEKLDLTQIKDKIKEVQNTLNQAEDGELHYSTIQMLNVPISTRIIELKSALNALRWIGCIKKTERHIIVVNIPSTTLQLYEQDKIVLESKIVAGKKSTPTPTLCSVINEVILYPYWNVPNKIAVSELLPAIKKNPEFLADNNYEVLDKQAKIIDPAKVNWQKLNKNNFPYTIRQSTGCDNSLGLIKLNFYNPYTVYLHDTPFKGFFKAKYRFYSHGCMRVERAFEVARYVLKNHSVAIDTLVQKGCLKNQSPVVIRASEIIPVFVLYHTAWADSAATVRFYPDVYKKVSLAEN